MAVIDEARRKEEEASLVVYYTGHGAVGPKDLWLQTAGQVKVGDGQGVKFSDLIVQARQITGGKGFEGDLVLILDACYSGTGPCPKVNLGRPWEHRPRFSPPAPTFRNPSVWTIPNIPR